MYLNLSLGKRSGGGEILQASSINAINTSAFSWGDLLDSTEMQSNGTVAVTTTNVSDGTTLTIELNNINYTSTITNNAATVTIPASDLQDLQSTQQVETYTISARLPGELSIISSSFTVERDTTTLVINPIATSAFSWGAVLDNTEIQSDGTVSVTTQNVTDGTTLTLTLDSIDYTSTVTSNASTVTIPASNLQDLQSTQVETYTITANLTGAAEVTSSSFDVSESVVVPVINAIGTGSFSWGALLDNTEIQSDGTVSVTTQNVADGTTITLTLDSIDYTSTVNSNAATVTISASALRSLQSSSTETYTIVANLTGAAQVTSSSFNVSPAPVINAIGTGAFSWGTQLSTVEMQSNGTVSVTTQNVVDGETLTLTLDSIDYTSTVNSNAATVTISASALQDLQSTQQVETYTITANLTGATQVTSSSFTVEQGQEANVLDNAYFALSTRKVVPTYTGFAMKVKVGSVEADVAFDSNDEVSLSSSITVTSGTSSDTTLGELSSGADARVVTWYNQGSASIDASQSTSSLQPRIVVSGTLQQNSNGDTSLLFDDHDNHMQCNGQVFTSDLSAAYGYSEHADGSYGGGLTVLIAQYTSSGTGRGGLGSGANGHLFFTNGTDTLAVRDSTHQSGNFSAATSADPTITSMYKTAALSGTAKWLQADTVRGKPTSGFGSGVTDTFNITHLAINTEIGGGNDGLAAKWDGYITEIITMKGTLSESDWETGFGEINDQYGVYS